VGWVHNARAAGQVSLRYGRATRQYATREVSAQEAGPVLKRYVAIATKTRAQFKATHDSPVQDFVAEADRHPVFELVAVGDDAPGRAHTAAASAHGCARGRRFRMLRRGIVGGLFGHRSAVGGADSVFSMHARWQHGQPSNYTEQAPRARQDVPGRPAGPNP